MRQGPVPPKPQASHGGLTGTHKNRSAVSPYNLCPERRGWRRGRLGCTSRGSRRRRGGVWPWHVVLSITTAATLGGHCLSLKDPCFLSLQPLPPTLLKRLEGEGEDVMLLLNTREYHFFVSFVSNDCRKSCTFFLRKKRKKEKNKGPNKTEQCYCIFEKYFYRLIFR